MKKLRTPKSTVKHVTLTTTALVAVRGGASDVFIKIPDIKGYR